MRHVKLLGVALMAVLALGSFASISAFAEEAKPNLLVAGGAAGTSFKDKGGEGLFEGKGLFGSAKLKCTSNTSTGAFTSEKLGTFDVLFLGCLVRELILLLCTGLNDTVTSSILVLGTFHLRRDPNNGPVIAYLIKPVHFSCVSGSTNVLQEVTGCAAGKISPANKTVKVGEIYTTELKASGTDQNEITKITNDTNSAKENCLLLTAENEGTPAQSAEITTDAIEPSAESQIMN